MDLTRGDSYAYKFQRIDEDGNVILEKADKIYFTVKRNHSTNNVILQKTIDDMIFDEQGYYHFSISPTDTNNLSYGSYVYDLEVKISDEYVKTIAQGTFKIKREVTFVTDEV